MPEPRAVWRRREVVGERAVLLLELLDSADLALGLRQAPEDARAPRRARGRCPRAPGRAAPRPSTGGWSGRRRDGLDMRRGRRRTRRLGRSPAARPGSTRPPRGRSDGPRRARCRASSRRGSGSDRWPRRPAPTTGRAPPATPAGRPAGPRGRRRPPDGRHRGRPRRCADDRPPTPPWPSAGPATPRPARRASARAGRSSARSRREARSSRWRCSHGRARCWRPCTARRRAGGRGTPRAAPACRPAGRRPAGQGRSAARPSDRRRARRSMRWSSWSIWMRATTPSMSRVMRSSTDRPAGSIASAAASVDSARSRASARPAADGSSSRSAQRSSPYIVATVGFSSSVRSQKRSARTLTGDVASTTRRMGLPGTGRGAVAVDREPDVGRRIRAPPTGRRSSRSRP